MEIVLKDICKSFGDKVLFDKFNLSVDQGEMLAIVGASGSGKTTLLNILGLLETPDSGEIVVNNLTSPFSEKKKLQLYRYTYGFLFQNYALVPNMTVDENLNVALKYCRGNELQKIKEAALSKVGLLDKKKQKVYRLSGGEQQRVALARLIIKPHTIILADEPTGSLDAKNRDLIISILKDLNEEGETIVLVTHDAVVANACSRVVNL